MSSEVEAVSIQGVVDAPQLDLMPKSLNAPIYKYRRIQQISGGTALQLTATGTTQSQFNIPAIVYNPSRCFVQLDVSIAASGAAGVLNSLHTDMVPLDSVIMQTLSSQPFVNLNYANIYSKTARFLCTDLNEYLSRGAVYGDTVLGTAFPITQLVGCQPCHALKNAQATTLQIIANIPTPAYIISAGASANALNATQASGVDDNNNFPQRLISGGANAILQVRLKIPFNAFPGTFMALDKDVYLGDITQLTLNYKPTNQWGFRSTVDCTTTLENLGVFTVSNYYLYIAEEADESNKASLKASYSSGYEFYCPHTFCNANLATAAGIFSLNYALNPSQGVLKRVVNVISNDGGVTGQLHGNLDNVNAVKWTQIQTFLDSKPLQDYILDFRAGDVYNWMYEMIKHTPSSITNRNFDIAPYFVDNFSDCFSGAEFPKNDTLQSGLAILESRTYTCQVNLVAGYRVLSYFTFVKKMSISSAGIVF